MFPHYHQKEHDLGMSKTRLSVANVDKMFHILVTSTFFKKVMFVDGEDLEILSKYRQVLTCQTSPAGSATLAGTPLVVTPHGRVKGMAWQSFGSVDGLMLFNCRCWF